MNLIEFLTVRLDEDEAIARGAARTDDGHDGRWLPIHFGSGGFDARVDDHIARYDPARVLREIEAKRALLRMHEPVPFWGNNPPPLKDRTPENVVAWYCECQCPDGMIQGAYPCDTARLLTAAWSDHPDYRPEWGAPQLAADS